MIVKIIGYTEQNYHRQIGLLSDKQVHMTHPPGLDHIGQMDAVELATDKYICGVIVHPEKIKTMVRFAVILERDK